MLIITIDKILFGKSKILSKRQTKKRMYVACKFSTKL